MRVTLTKEKMTMKNAYKNISLSSADRSSDINDGERKWYCHSKDNDSFGTVQKTPLIAILFCRLLWYTISTAIPRFFSDYWSSYNDKETAARR